MSYKIDLQNPNALNGVPSIFQFNRWAKAALTGRCEQGELSIVISNLKDIQALNQQYRQIDKPTNVLSFPFELPKEVELPMPLLGDIVLCAEVIEQEALTLGISSEAHWAHLTIHGVLHLLGFDHITPDDAAVMEPIEVAILKKLMIDNPYEVKDDTTNHED